MKYNIIAGSWLQWYNMTSFYHDSGSVFLSTNIYNQNIDFDC